MPDRYLVDTSVWLEVLPHGGGSDALRERISGLLAADLVATMGMVRLELLGGARSAGEWRRLRHLLSALHQLHVTENRWDEAAELGLQLRREGTTVPFTDLLIAAVALGEDAVVLHRDRHFDLLASQASLRVESHVPG